MSNPAPTVGKWYQEPDEGFVFEVVALDEEAGTIEVQHIDGEINEFDEEVWDEFKIEQISAPEDWRNAYELSNEDSTDTEPRNPINGIEPQVTNGLLDD